MDNRRLLFAIIAVLVFAIGIISWFFFYSTPKAAPTLGEPTNSNSLKDFPKKFQFIFNNEEEAPPSEITTEVTFKGPEVLTEIWNKPAAGQTFVQAENVVEVDATSTQGTTTISIKKLVRATSTVLMFVDRTTGYVYTYNRELGKIYQVSNTTLPGIYDAYIFNEGKSIVMRYEDKERQTIVGVLATIPRVTEKDQAKSLENITYLPSQVTSIAVNKKGTELSYLVTGDTGSSIYTITNKNTTLTANTPFKEWKLAYGGEDLFATTKPSAYLEGQTVRIPSFEFTIGDKTGLMSNPGESGMFLASMWSKTGLKTFLSLYGRQVVLSQNTLASKCTWGDNNFLICAVPKYIPRKTEGLPDDWFQGRFLFNDSLFIVDSKTADILPLYSFDESLKLSFDITNIAISRGNALIAFTRKQNATLWLLDTDLISAD